MIEKGGKNPLQPKSHKLGWYKTGATSSFELHQKMLKIFIPNVGNKSSQVNCQKLKIDSLENNMFFLHL